MPKGLKLPKAFLKNLKTKFNYIMPQGGQSFLTLERPIRDYNKGNYVFIIVKLTLDSLKHSLNKMRF